MNLGCELDGLVAEKVMGWRKHLTTEGYRWTTPYGHPLENCKYDKDIPMYSSNISAAWSVIEKIKDQRWVRDAHTDIVTEVRIAFEKSGFYEVRLMDQHCNTWACVEAENLPEALCLAALQILGIEV